jgi:predicted GNAT superfamily acetyltransferase
VLIRKLERHEEYRAAEEIQRRVWHFPWREVIPLNELVVAQKNGGHVFGAFEKGRMVGFCFGVPGFRDGKVYHYSRMLGVLAEYQDRGVGRLLKLKQREYALEQGLDLARWTFDPLQSRNAYLNIEKLGCVVREYLVNIYPGSGSRFNRGLDTDRFVPEWWIRSKRVRDRIAGRGTPTLDEACSNYAPVIAGEPLREKGVSLEIPSDIDAIKRKDLAEARAWRQRTRRAFLALFKAGYAITGFATGVEGGLRRSLYLLEKGCVVR